MTGKSQALLIKSVYSEGFVLDGANNTVANDRPDETLYAAIRMPRT
jgi:hypothetical protein